MARRRDPRYLRRHCDSLQQPDTDRHLFAIEQADRLAIERHRRRVRHRGTAKPGEQAPADLDNFSDASTSDTLFGEHEASVARAFHAFGKGRHAAGLNFGDCLSYAVSGTYNDVLLYKGDDFSQTPIPSALDHQT